jgi:hypothetical protein
MVAKKNSPRPTRQHLSVGSGHESKKNPFSPLSLSPPRQKIAALGQRLGFELPM